MAVNIQGLFKDLSITSI